MIARHDLVLGLCLSVSLCHCLYFLTPLPNLLILCVSLFLCPLYSSTSFSFHTEPVYLLFFVIYSLSFSIYCLSIAFILSGCLCSASVLLILLLSHVCILYFSICLSSTAYYYFSLFSPPLLPPSLALSTPPFFSMFLFLSTSTTCATEGNIASSGPCWTITMQSNPNRDVCRKQHVCNYCLMRPLSQAECPIRLPMRKWCQGPVKKERKDGAKRSRVGDREVEVRRLQHGEKGVEDEKHRGEMEQGEYEKLWKKEGSGKKDGETEGKGERWRERGMREFLRCICGVMAELIALSRG